MFRRWLSALLVAFAVVPVGEGIALGAEPELLYKIGCPPVWPGPEGPQPLTYHDARIAWRGVTTNDGQNKDLSFSKPGDIQMDCAYGPAGYNSWRRISIQVPGHVQKCTVDGPWTNPGPLICRTRPPPGEDLGAIAWRIATPVTADLKLFGMGLKMSGKHIRDLGRREGYEVEEAPDHLTLSRPGRRFDIAMIPSTDHPREIALRSDEFDTVGKAVFTFGFGYEWEPAVNEVRPPLVWLSPDQNTALEFWPPNPEGERPSLHLIDRRGASDHYLRRMTR